MMKSDDMKENAGEGLAEPTAAKHPQPQGPAYRKPQIVTWSAEELESAGTALNACVSYGLDF